MSAIRAALVREREAAEGPAVVKALWEEGYAFVALLVVKFHDTNEGDRWWRRQHEELGYIVTPMDGPCPMDEAGLLACAHAEFGADCAVIY